MNKMTITNKKLKELLDQYPDDAFIYAITNNYGTDDYKEIETIVIDYVNSDDYTLPRIGLK